MSCSMARKIMKAGTTTINRAHSAAPASVEHYSRDLHDWPRSWMADEKDLPPGADLVAAFRPFLEYLTASDLSPKTIQKHLDDLWLLGGEIIRDLHYDPSLRKKVADQLLRSVIHQDGGPLVHNGSGEEQRSFDATCRKLHRFHSQSQS